MYLYFRMFNIINGGQYAENFQEIHDVSEIEHFGHVLIVPTGGEKIKNNVYYNIHGKQNFRITTSPRAGQAHNFPPFPEVGQQYRHSRNLNK